MKNKRPDDTIDVRDLIAPISVLKVETRLSAMKPGEILEVICADRDTKSDLKKIAKNAGHHVLAVNKAIAHYQLILERGNQ